MTDDERAALIAKALKWEGDYRKMHQFRAAERIEALRTALSSSPPAAGWKLTPDDLFDASDIVATENMTLARTLTEAGRAMLAAAPSPPATDSVAPSLGSSEADALTQLLAISGPLADAASAVITAYENGDDTCLPLRDPVTALLVAVSQYRVAIRSLESKAQDGSSLQTSPDPVLSNGEKK